MLRRDSMRAALFMRVLPWLRYLFASLPPGGYLCAQK